MSNNDQQGLHEARLQKEIDELRSDLGETVEALVHKADLPARAKERGTELTEHAIERGIELHEQAVERGSELGGRVIKRGSELTDRVIEHGTKLQDRVGDRGSELRDWAVDAAERARKAVSQTPKDRWTKLAYAGLAVLAMMVMLRRVRTS